MSVTTTAAAAASQTGNAARSGSATISDDFDTFLTLLTTQLQNQSPDDPLDTNEMTAQLVQFAQVEQQMQMNDHLSDLVSLQESSQLVAAAPLIGERVEVESERIALQDGSAELRLPAAGSATEARVQVLDGSGRTIREQVVPLGSSPTTWRWDGRDSGGRRMNDGSYRVAVTGGADGETARALGYTVVGRVTGASGAGDGLSLQLGGLTVGMDRLRSIGA